MVSALIIFRHVSKIESDIDLTFSWIIHAIVTGYIIIVNEYSIAIIPKMCPIIFI